MPELWSSRVSGVPTLTEQALLSAPANVLVMYPGEQRMGWVPGMGVQGSWGKDGGGPTGIQLLEWQPRERNGVGSEVRVKGRILEVITCRFLVVT